MNVCDLFLACNYTNISWEYSPKSTQAFHLRLNSWGSAGFHGTRILRRGATGVDLLRWANSNHSLATWISEIPPTETFLWYTQIHSPSSIILQLGQSPKCTTHASSLPTPSRSLLLNDASPRARVYSLRQICQRTLGLREWCNHWSRTYVLCLLSTQPTFIFLIFPCRKIHSSTCLHFLICFHYCLNFLVKRCVRQRYVLCASSDPTQ